MALNYEETINHMWGIIFNSEEDDWFSSHYSEQLKKCDFHMENENVNEMTLKQIKEYVDEISQYTRMREIIESINKFKEDFEKQHKLKESYKKVNKKQSDKIKELKKEIAEKEQLNQEKKEFYENLADKAKEATSIIKNQKHQIHQLEATIETIKCLKEQVDASLKEENEELKKENEKHKKELLIASFDGYKAGCNYNQSVQDEVDFLNESGESAELIKEVFDESYEGGLNLVYNIETKDYSGEEEEEEGHYAVCETCDKKLFDDGQYSSITSCTYCDDCYEKLDSDEKEEEDEDEFEEPSKCMMCDKKFCMYEAKYGAQEEAYDKYFGSNKDDGDLCEKCIVKVE